VSAAGCGMSAIAASPGQPHPTRGSSGSSVRHFLFILRIRSRPYGLSWLDLAGRRLRLDRLAATAVADFFPLPAVPAFLAHQTSRRPAVLRVAPARNRVRRRSLPARRSPSRLRWSRARNRDQRRITMANIGSFKKVNAELGHAERSVLFAK